MSRALVLVALLAAPAAAQPPDFNRQSVTSALRLYADPAVQAELKLTGEQKAKLGKIPDEVLAKNKDAIDKEAAEAKDAAAKRAAKQAEVEKQFDALLEKLLTAAQRLRLNQLAVQARGVNVFRDDAVLKALGLPADAPTKLTEFMRAAAEKLRAEYPDRPPFSRNADDPAARKYAEANRTMQRDVIAKFAGTFTADQKKAWAEMTGEPSDAAVPAGGVVRPARLSFLFAPPTRVYGLHAALNTVKVLDELKVEKTARDALADGLKAVEQAARAAGPMGGFGGGFGGPFRSNVSTTLGLEASAAAAGLLAPAQAKRLDQIRFQLRGAGVFAGDGVAFTDVFVPFARDAENPLRKLTLTPAQVAKIDAVLADAAAKRQPLGNRGPGFGFPVLGRGPETADQKAERLAWTRQVADVEKAAVAEIVATFDDGQKAVWKELAGVPIDVAAVEAYTPTRTGPGGFGPGIFGGLRSSVVDQWTQEAGRRQQSGEYAAALALYDEAIRLAPAERQLVQFKADLLATCPSEWVRDGKQAVELMTKVMAQMHEPSHMHHNVMAAALAAAGRFEEAAKAQEKAIAGLPAPRPATADSVGWGPGGFDLAAQLKPGYEARLKLYREGKPYRMPPPQAGWRN